MTASPWKSGCGLNAPRICCARTPILYADERKGCSPRCGAGNWPRCVECSGRRQQRGRGELALRYAASGVAVVAAYIDSAYCWGSVKSDSFGGANAGLCSAVMAACGGRLRCRETVHLGVLASRNNSDCVVASKSWHGGDEYHGV